MPDPKREGHMVLSAFLDGASNPNGSSVGIAIDLPSYWADHSRRLCVQNGDPNHVEYAALFYFLLDALKVGCKNVRAYSDSDVVVKQMRGVYRCESQLVGIHWACMLLVRKLDSFEISHVRRTENTVAHALARNALSGKGLFV